MRKTSLVASAEDAGVERFVLASSAAVYGEHGPVALSGAAPLNGASLYARTKISAEEILDLSALPGAVSLRILNVRGPGFDSSLVERLRRSREDARSRSRARRISSGITCTWTTWSRRSARRSSA